MEFTVCRATLFFILCLGMAPICSLASKEMIGNEGLLLKLDPKSDYRLSSEGVFRTDLVWLNNGIDLDNKNNNDSFEYLGIDYKVNLDFEYRDLIELFVSLERNGPSDFDAPVLGRRAVRSSFGDVQRYKNKGFLPEVEQWFADVKFPHTESAHLKFGLFPMNVGNGIAAGSYYENYGFELYQDHDPWAWHFHYFRPDWNNDVILGPNLTQEERLGRGNQKTVADLFVLDAQVNWNQPSIRYIPGGSLQPYISLLSDRTGVGKRSNIFAVQTEQDLLGTLGADLNLVFGRLELGFEAARNFGEAQALGDSEDINHRGYMFYTDAALDLKEIRSKPRTRFLVLSGNDLHDSEDGLIHGSSNKAFSVFSPTNQNLNDSVYPPQLFAPAAASGNSSGINFGVLRPGSFNDPYPIDNIIAPNIGVDIKPWDRLSIALDWWYMAAMERGIGTWDGTTKKLSPDLGHELSINTEIKITKFMTVGCLLAYFLPGKYYQELRDDQGTTLSPLIRGDGDVDNFFVGELRLTVSY